MNNVEFRKMFFAAVCIFVILSATAFSERPIVNYDKHPDLVKAMEYDLTMDMTRFIKPDGTIDDKLFDSYVKKADQKLAEKHYLAYLEDVNEPFQRARVYSKLGSLYLGTVSQHVTPRNKKNLSKALEYYKKVLEEVPDAISIVTVSARGAMTMDPELSSEESFYALMDYYEWLASIDEEKVKENWLPLWPGSPNAVLSDKAAKNMTNFCQGHKETMAINLVLDAVDFGRNGNIQYLLELMDKFPEGTAKEYLAKRLSEIISGDITTEHLKNMQSAEKGINRGVNKIKSEKINKFFIPTRSIARKHDKPFVFDLKDEKLIMVSLDKENNQQMNKKLTDLGKGDIAWDGSLVTFRDANALTVVRELKRPLETTKGKWINSYKLPAKVKLPYSALIKTKERENYLIAIYEIQKDGIWILYKDLDPDKVKYYLPTQ